MNRCRDCRDVRKKTLSAGAGFRMAGTNRTLGFWLFAMLSAVAPSAGTAQQAAGPSALPRAAGAYMGMKWEVDDDHMLWWDGKPYIPYASFGISPDNELGITEFNPWIDNDPFAANPRLTRAQHIDSTRRRFEAITRAGGTCLPLLAVANPLRPDGYQTASRAREGEGPRSRIDAARLADGDVKRRIVKVWEEYAPALRQPCLRGLILWNEINAEWIWGEERSPQQHARVLGEYVKEAKRVFGDLPIVLKITGRFHAMPVITAAARHADGLGFDIWLGATAEGGVDSGEAQRYIGDVLELLRQRQTKTTWFFIAEGGRRAGPEHREGQGEYWDAWPPFRSEREARDILRAYAMQGVKGFIYNGPSFASYRHSQQWFAGLKPEIVRIMRETKPQIVAPRVGNAQQAIAAAEGSARVKKLLASYQNVGAEAAFSQRYGLWLVHFFAAGRQVGFASVSRDGKVLEVSSGE